ncbi:MAG: transposase family protein, partial [Pseudoalteromonas sp.]|nr:transposase family protein [Pseudoalteromonas sp.]
MADSAVLKKGFNGAWYVLVVVDAFSGSAFYEAIRRLSARSTAKAFEKILFRFKNATIKRLDTDRGSEVSAMYLVSLRKYIWQLILVRRRSVPRNAREI